MSETAQTLIKAALRSIGAIATGETPTAAELADGLEAMQMMFRNWSAQNIRLYYTKQETLTMSGATSYTIGSGGVLNTTRPASIRGAWTTDGPVKVIDEDQYRQYRMSVQASPTVEWLWYSPEYPLGLLYPWPLGGSTLYIDTQIPLTDPSAITDSISFPTEYDDAIKWNLAVRLAPEYGKEPTQTVYNLAVSTLAAIETRNFAHQINAVRPEVIKLGHVRYNIDAE
jgi:hypothetical protein